MGRAFEYRRAAKEKRWDKMSRVFPRLAKNITLAAKEGGPDPELNAKLRNAILAAKAENMPKDNIESAIKRASGKDAEALVEVVYEGKGPHGVLVVIETATDNTTRTVANHAFLLSTKRVVLLYPQDHWNTCSPERQFSNLPCRKVLILRSSNSN